jgi:hypothetical protein
MSATIETAYDEIYGLFKTAWDAGVATTGKKILYDGVDADLPNDDVWARIAVRHSTGDQATLSNFSGQRRWERRGTVFVQLFTDLQLTLSSRVAVTMIAEAAFQGKATASGVWFRNVRVNEVGRDGRYYQVNVLAEFVYDEVR